jgi:hypothetical protein
MTGGGDLSGRNTTTCRGTGVIPPEDPEKSATTDGTISVWGLFSLSWTSASPIVSTSPPSRTYTVGFTVAVSGPGGSSDTDTAGTSVTTSAKVIQSEDGTGSWSVSAECEWCLEVTEPTVSSGAGYYPDQPITTSHRLFLRTKSGGAWSADISLGGAAASISGTFASATELSMPDGLSLAANATVESAGGAGGETATAETLGEWRGAAVAESRSVSGANGSATADGTGCTATATCDDDEGGSAASSLSVAVPLSYSLEAQLRAMEHAYPDSLTLSYQRGGATVDVSATSSYSDSRTYRSESSHVETTDTSNVTTDDDYSYPSDFGAISLQVKSTSLTALLEPTTDPWVLLKDRYMAAVTVEVPADSGNLSRGADSALAGSPWGVVRSFAAATPAWQGLMGWSYLEIVAAETGGASAGAAVSIKIGSRTWTQDYTGAALTTPGSGASATWRIDLTAPDASGPTDATLTTYPYNDNWDTAGGDEDDYYRTGEGSLSGVLYATSIRVEVGSSTTLTLTSVKGKRTSANTVYATNLPAHRAYFSERPDREVSEAGTTTVYRVRPCFYIDLEGRQLAAEWSDISWQQTTGGMSGVVTNSVDRHSIDWLASRINGGFLTPGWSATIVAAAYSATGLAAWYNRERSIDGLLGSGYHWLRPSLSGPSGAWVSGLDWAMRPSGGAATIPWQGGFTTLTSCHGNPGDLYLHGNEGTAGTLVLVGAKIMRAQGIGTAYDSDGLRESGQSLTADQGGAVGSGTTDSLGYAQTGLNYPRGDGGSTSLSLRGHTGVFTTYARYRLRWRAKEATTPAGCLVCILSTREGLTWIATSESDGTIRVRRSDHPNPSSWALDVVVTAGPTDTAPCLGIDAGGGLWLMYHDGADAKQRVSYDAGATFGAATTMFTGGNHPRMLRDDSGSVLRAALVQDGADFKIRAHVQHPGDASPGTEFYLRYYSGGLTDLLVEDACFDIDSASEGGDRYLLICIVAGETSPSTWSSSDGGQTWTRTV